MASLAAVNSALLDKREGLNLSERFSGWSEPGRPLSAAAGRRRWLNTGVARAGVLPSRQKQVGSLPGAQGSGAPFKHRRSQRASVPSSQKLVGCPGSSGSTGSSTGGGGSGGKEDASTDGCFSRGPSGAAVACPK